MVKKWRKKSLRTMLKRDRNNINTTFKRNKHCSKWQIIKHKCNYVICNNNHKCLLNKISINNKDLLVRHSNYKINKSWDKIQMRRNNKWWIFKILKRWQLILLSKRNICLVNSNKIKDNLKQVNYNKTLNDTKPSKTN